MLIQLFFLDFLLQELIYLIDFLFVEEFVMAFVLLKAAVMELLKNCFLLLLYSRDCLMNRVLVVILIILHQVEIEIMAIHEILLLLAWHLYSKFVINQKNPIFPPSSIIKRNPIHNESIQLYNKLLKLKI